MDQPLPHNDAAERATLGAILLDREAIIPIAAWLHDDHFYIQTHAWIYAAQLACYERRVPPDLTTVADELRRTSRLDEIGGVPYLIELSNSVPTAYHVEYYAKIVERTAVLRRVIQAGGQIAQLGFDDTGDVETTLAAAEQALQDAALRPGRAGFVPFATIADEFYTQLAAAEDQRDALNLGIPTGLVDLDRMLGGGLHNADLLILAARPGVGKSALAMSIGYSIAQQQNLPVGVFALEMGRDSLFQRVLATYTGIDSQRLRTGRVSTEELQQLVDASGQLSTLPIHIDDTPGITVAEIRAKARRLQAEQGLRVLIIDYLQLISGSGRKNENRVQEVSEISRQLKLLARELNIPVIALSQLSRAVEGRSSHVPQLADLRESGSIEQDADVVMFIYREEMYDKDTDKKGIAEIHIAKHRNGPLGVVSLFFDHRTTRFATLAPYASVEGY